jgi:hypothetical protein
MPQLTNLDVEWVSLVDRAAVRDPVEQSEPMRFLIWKRDTDTDPSKGGRTMSKLTKELVDQLGDRVEKADEFAPLVEKAADSDQAALALDGAARLLAAHKDELDAETVAKFAELTGLELPEAGPGLQPKTAAEVVDALKVAEVAEAVVKEVEDAIAKAAEDAKIEKADPETRAAIKKAEERAEKAEKIAKEERDTRLKGEFIAKAEKLDHLSIKAEDFGPVLKSASEKLTKEEYEALEGVLKASNEQIEKGALFAEAGAGGIPVAADAMAELQQKAEEIKKADPKLSDHEALDKAMTDNPELQQRYLDEARA